jgi:hypothetical protein
MLTRQKVFRADGRIELICIHGIGHTMAIPKEYDNEHDRQAWFSHTCDGCCELRNGIYKIQSKEQYEEWKKQDKTLKNAPSVD